MKRTVIFALFFALLLSLCLALLAGCGESAGATAAAATAETTTPTGTVCEHEWVRAGNYDRHTAVDRCVKCGQTRMYTDSESMPKQYAFDRVFRVCPVGTKTTCSNARTRGSFGS